MQNSDVKGCQTRLAAVFYSLAVDFIRDRILTGRATRNDIISVLWMGEESKVFIDKQPTD